ncbi:hypothetical protein P879_02662 [Paragonimus westermani]|uniref:Ras-associating domain-containing protein n=1 Tax=Paragonimus westermani TaxID=34504 RepID=A0A8T0DQW7_9TREM|nr:hypothetical protein P879_02662 [Paragonimus westermani]
MSRSLHSNYSRSDQSREHKSVHWSNDVETESSAMSNGSLSQENLCKNQFKWSHPVVDTPIWTPSLNPIQPTQTEQSSDLGTTRTVSLNRSQSVGPSVRPKANTGNFHNAISFPATLADIITAKTNPTSPTGAADANRFSNHSNIPLFAGIKNTVSQLDQNKLPTTFDQRWLNANKEHRFQADMCHGNVSSPIHGSEIIKYRDPYKSLERTEEEHTDVQKPKTVSTTKVVLRVYQPDRTTKAVAIEAHTTAFEVLELLLEKNILPCTTKYALVEKIPSLKLERCFEDSELVMDCVINWNVCSENLIFFEEREDMYGIFENPKDMFVLNNELNIPGHSEHLYVRTNGSNWKRRFCMLRNSGLYVSKQYSKNISAFQRIVSFKPYLRLYTTTGGWKKMLAPTPFGFTVRVS